MDGFPCVHVIVAWAKALRVVACGIDPKGDGHAAL
jgi:hypothetical protein